MYTDPQILYDTALSLDMNARHRYFMHGYHHYTTTVVQWTWDYMRHWPLWWHVLVIHIYVTRIIATHICSTGTRIYLFTEYHISYYCYYHYMDARYIVLSCLHITVSIFLCVYAGIPVAWLFSVNDIPITGYMSCWYTTCGTKCHVDSAIGATSRIPYLLFPVSRYRVSCYQQRSVTPALCMCVAITSPYPWNRGITEWYQSLGSQLVWVTMWVNTWALTNSTVRFRFNLICIWIWGFQHEYKNTMLLTIRSLFYSSRISDFLLAFFPSHCFQSI